MVVLPYVYAPPSVASTVVPAGGITFDVSPINAAVYADGQYMGVVSDFTSRSFFTSWSNPLRLTEGRHRIELQADGYVPTTFEVDIVGGSVVPYKDSLEAAPYQAPPPVSAAPHDLGGITFDVSPTGASVYIDDQYMGLTGDLTPTSLQPLWLTPGRHRVELKAEGHVTTAFDVDVIGGAVVHCRGRLADGTVQKQ